MRRSAFVALLSTLVLVLASCGGGEEVSPTAETVAGTAPTDTSGGPAGTEGETTGETTGETSGETTGETTGETNGETTGEGGGNAANGEEVYASAGCGSCHTLSAAGSNGSIGPNLDDAKPSHDLVVDRVTNGQGAMPAFKDQLSEQEIQDVAAFVSSSAGS